jgi:hypothetical protein
MEQEYRERKTGYMSMIRGGLLQVCTLLLRHYGRDTPRTEINRVFFSIGYKENRNPFAESREKESLTTTSPVSLQSNLTRYTTSQL